MEDPGVAIKNHADRETIENIIVVNDDREHEEKEQDKIKKEYIDIIEENISTDRVIDDDSVNLEKQIIKNALKMYETKAKEVMVPRTSVFAINIQDDTGENIDRIIEERYSRVPVYDKDIDNVIGIIHTKDLFAQSRKGNMDLINIRGMIREPFLVHEFKNISDLLIEMKKLRNHMAVVIDEYGGFSGVITIEDIMEELIGDIFDEDDEDYSNEQIKKISPKTYIIDGLTNISDINEDLKLNLPTDVTETIGGFLLSCLGELPVLDNPNYANETTIDSVTLKAIKVNNKRIEEILLRKN